MELAQEFNRAADEAEGPHGGRLHGIVRPWHRESLALSLRGRRLGSSLHCNERATETQPRPFAESSRSSQAPAPPGKRNLIVVELRCPLTVPR